jgi:hypothetical protein
MSDDKDPDFNEYFAIYLPANQTLATVGAWLAQRMPTATLSVVDADGTHAVVSVARRTQAPSLLRATLDATPAVRAEVIARAKRGNAAVRNALRPAMQRLDLDVSDERAKVDDLYDVFRALVAMPGAVGVVASDADSFLELFVGESEEALATVDMSD